MLVPLLQQMNWDARLWGQEAQDVPVDHPSSQGTPVHPSLRGTKVGDHRSASLDHEDTFKT
jgi:hypothetical protein